MAGKKLLLATKLKNLINNAYPDNNYIIEVKNIKLNGQSRGCSGFIKNPETGSVIFLTTEKTGCSWLKDYMYRYESQKRGFGRNRWTSSQEELVRGIHRLLAEPMETVTDF